MATTTKNGNAKAEAVDKVMEQLAAEASGARQQAAGAAGAAAQPRGVTISAPDIRTVMVRIIGTAPYMQARFSQKALNIMREKQAQGSVANSRRTREARDFSADFEGAKHVSTEGWVGIPASAIRAASISACRLVGFKMTLAKLSIFVEPDGFDKVDGVPLVKLIGPEPESTMMPVRNATGVVDLRVRPMWREWAADLRIRYDAQQFTSEDVLNLLARVGLQVGIGEGRPDSKESVGLGFGTFRLATEEDMK